MYMYVCICLYILYAFIVVIDICMCVCVVHDGNNEIMSLHVFGCAMAATYVCDHVCVSLSVHAMCYLLAYS